MQRIIDTHVHIWDLDRAAYPWLEGDASILHRTYLLPELEAERQHAGITAGVLVQAAGNKEDTALMLDAAKQNEWIEGVVGWLPLTDPTSTHALLQQKYCNEPYFKGVRHQVHDESNPSWLLQPAVIDSLRTIASYDLPYDMVGVVPAHIETAIQVGNEVPGLRLVFDHLNQPPIAGKEKFGQWGALMKAAAQNSNFYVKISGLGTASGNFSGRTADDIRPYVAFALETFGADRCFCGGDWPVSLLAGSYTATWQLYETVLSSLLNETEKEKVLYSNAVNFYRLAIND